MKTIYMLSLFLISLNSFAFNNTYCQSNGDNQTRCTTYNQNGSTHNEYYSQDPFGGSHKSNEFDLGNTNQEDSQ